MLTLFPRRLFPKHLPTAVTRLLTLLGLLLLPATLRPAPAPAVLKNLVYGRAGGHDLKLDLYQPAFDLSAASQRSPVIVFLHGGGWRVGSKAEAENVVDAVTGAGYALASVDYRLSSEAIYPAQIQDSKTAVRWLRANAAKYGLDPKRVGVIGFSAGGHLAALLGTSAGVEALEGRDEGSPRESSRVQAVCDVSGPVDLAIPTHSIIGKLSVYGELAGPASAKPDLVRAANPTTYISGKEPPFLIIQGGQDQLVIAKHAELLADALRKKGGSVLLVTVQGGGHIPFGPDQSDTTIRFFKRVFGK